MTPSRFRVVAFAAALAAFLLAHPACKGSPPQPSPSAPAPERATPDGPTHAADGIIENTKDPDERARLERARDEVDAEMRERARALDAEIEAVRKENEKLRE